MLFWPPLFAWVTSICFSRLLLYRHHILDIIAGVLLGITEAGLMSLLWMEKDTSAWILSWLSEEKLPGSMESE